MCKGLSEKSPEAALGVVEALHHAIHQASLPWQTGPPRAAAVLPGVQLAVDAEDADLDAGHVDDHAPAFSTSSYESDHDRVARRSMVLLT